MTTLICTQCAHELFTATPRIWEGSVHIGCGGRYYPEIEKALLDPSFEHMARALDILFKEEV